VPDRRTPGRSALPTKIRTPVTGVFRSTGADASMLPRIPSSEGPTDDRLARLSHDRRWYIAKRVVARHLKARKPDPRCTCPRTVPHAGGEGGRATLGSRAAYPGFPFFLRSLMGSRALNGLCWVPGCL
jgi:hypothetical protein